MPSLRSHTHLQPSQADTQTKACKRVCLSSAENKKLELPPLLKFKNANTQPQLESGCKTLYRHGCDKWTKKTPACNMRLASCGANWLNSSSVFQINLGAMLTVLCFEISHERQAQNR